MRRQCARLGLFQQMDDYFQIIGPKKKHIPIYSGMSSEIEN